MNSFGKKGLFYLIILAMFLIGQSSLKSLEHDNELWTGIEADFSLMKRLRLELGQQFRFNNDISSVKNILTDVGLSYKPFDFLRLSASYRLKFNKNDMDETRHVLYGSMYLYYEARRLQLSYRLKFEKEYKQTKDDEDLIRNRLKFKYNLKGAVDPYALAEIYYRYNWDKGDKFNKYRISAGVDIDTWDRQGLTIFLLYQEEFDVKNPKASAALGIYYNFSIKDLGF